MATLETRSAQLSDAVIMSRLTLELGHDCTEVLMRKRLLRLRDRPEHAVFVAALDGSQVVGWVHAELRNPVWGEPFVELTGLVVSIQQQRKGVGRALVDRARVWADSLGVGDLRASAQLHRESAHDFFESIGFELFEERQVWRIIVEDIDVGGHPTLVD